MTIFANDIDECENSPCAIGQICNNLENMYTCTCPAGTTGANCEQGETTHCSTLT